MTRQRGPEDLTAGTSLPSAEVVSRLRDAIESRRSIETDPSTRSRRRLSGSIDGTHLQLTILDDNAFSRRIGWEIEFNGEVEETYQGSALRGTIDIPDRAARTAMLRLLGIGCVLVAMIAFGLAARTAMSGGVVDLGPPGMSLVVSSIGIVALIYLQRFGEAAAAVDAGLLIECLRRLLRPEGAGS